MYYFSEITEKVEQIVGSVNDINEQSQKVNHYFELLKNVQNNTVLKTEEGLDGAKSIKEKLIKN